MKNIKKKCVVRDQISNYTYFINHKLSIHRSFFQKLLYIDHHTDTYQ